MLIHNCQFVIHNYMNNKDNHKSTFEIHVTNMNLYFLLTIIVYLYMHAMIIHMKYIYIIHCLFTTVAAESTMCITCEIYVWPTKTSMYIYLILRN